MGNLQKQHYKETTPEETVHKIRDILYDLKLFTTDCWLSNNSKDLCHSLRVTGGSGGFGTNGKGVTREYALASAYAEFCERIQNNMLLLSIENDSDMGFFYYADEKELDALALIRQGDPFIKKLCSTHHLDLHDAKACAEQFSDTFRSQEFMGRERGKYLCIPYYSVNDENVYYLPYDIYSFYYGSNGMCAGNTQEEALSQGISELFERYVQRKVIREKIALPDIPEDYIRKFPHVHHIFTELKKRNKDKFQYYLKDCSLGGRYPVAAFVSIEKNTGCYGVKFGAHPDYGIAMERTLTEAFQGRDGEGFVHSSFLDFMNFNVESTLNVYNSFKLGIAQYPVELFESENAGEFRAVPDVSRLTNHEILDGMIKIIKEEGFDLLVRNVSYLGFPSYQVIVPGMSELIDLSPVWTRLANTSMFTAKKIRKINSLSNQELDIIIRCIDSRINSSLENRLSSLFSMPISYPYPGNECGFGVFYLSAMCRYKQRNYEDAALRMERFMGLQKRVEQKENPLYRCMLEYMKGKRRDKKNDEIMQVLRRFYSEDIANETEQLLIDPEAVLARQYPPLDCPKCAKCSIREHCDYMEYKQIRDTLKKKQSLYFPNQEDLITVAKA